MRQSRAKFVALGVAILLVIVATFWVARKPRKPVHVGDARTTVIAKLGDPTAVFTNGFVWLKYGGEVSDYGRKVDQKAAVKGDFPFWVRLLAPDHGDVIVVFNTSGVVKALDMYK